MSDIHDAAAKQVLFELFQTVALPDGVEATIAAGVEVVADENPFRVRLGLLPIRGIYIPTFEFSLSSVPGSIVVSGKTIDNSRAKDIVNFVMAVAKVRYGYNGETVCKGLKLEGCPCSWARWLDFFEGVAEDERY